MARTEERTALPTTSHAILGLLTFGEMSGYDVVKVAERSVGFFWTPAKSQVYSELRRLVELGYATERPVEQTDRPDKRLYRITEEGERALRAWLESGRVEPDAIRSAFFVKVFFGGLADPERLGDQVRRYLQEARDRLEQLRTIEDQIKDVDEMLFPYLTLRAGLAHSRASIRWARDVLEELERRERT